MRGMKITKKKGVIFVFDDKDAENSVLGGRRKMEGRVNVESYIFFLVFLVCSHNCWCKLGAIYLLRCIKNLTDKLGTCGLRNAKVYPES